ncbi:MAG TPA: MFS transporter [Pseudonocardia sp.]|nr:MFS transporter [Pseudonocardia sp.]
MAGIILVALILRSPVTGLGAVLGQVTADLHLNGLTAGIATTLPVVCFAVLGGLAPLAARRSGAERVLAASMVISAVGLAVRAASGSAELFLVATAAALTGAAVGNVLMPAMVRGHFPNRVGPMTALYTTTLAVGMTAGAALTVPLQKALGGGWRTGLGCLTVFAAAAALPWLVLSARSGRRSGPAVGASDDYISVSVSADHSARALMVFFGAQSLNAYAVFGWLPSIAATNGTPDAGILLPIVSAMAIPISVMMPTLAARLGDQRPLVVLTTVCYAGGYLWLLVLPGAVGWPAAVLLGAGNGAFPLAVTLVGLRSMDQRVTAALSGFVQGGGYLLAAAGPLFVGVLHQYSGGWGLPLMLLLLTLVPQLLFGFQAGAPGAVRPVWRRAPRHSRSYAQTPAQTPAGTPAPTRAGVQTQPRAAAPTRAGAQPRAAVPTRAHPQNRPPTQTRAHIRAQNALRGDDRLRSQDQPLTHSRPQARIGALTGPQDRTGVPVQKRKRGDTEPIRRLSARQLATAARDR